MTSPQTQDAAPLALDPFWTELQVFLRTRYASPARLIIPAPLHKTFDHALCPQDLGDEHPDHFDAVTIHKGDYTSFAADFLYRVLIRYRPIFANPVFLVMAPPDQDRVEVDASHTGVLEDMLAWASAHAAHTVVQDTVPIQQRYTPNDTLQAMARLIARDLVKPIEGTGLMAVAETAIPFAGSRWFWGDDAAKVAELFCLPALHHHNSELADQLIDIVLALSPGTIIQRRIGPAELIVEAERSIDFRILGAFTITFGDLSRGRIYQAIRFNDGRTRPIACFTPGVLHFTWRGRPQTCDLADSIFSHRVERQGDDVLLWHISTIRHPDDVTRELGTVTYTYRLSPSSSTIRLDMIVTPAAFITLKDVTASSVLNELDELGAFDGLTLLDTDNAARQLELLADDSDDGAMTSLPVDGATRYMCLWEQRILPGHAIGVHIAPGASIRSACRVQAPDDGQMAKLTLSYGAGAATRRKPFTIRESRLITAGGYYDDAAGYADLIQRRDKTGWCHDPSMSYDIGVELNAVATWLFFARKGHYEAASPDRIASLRAWYDKHLALYLGHLQLDAPNKHERIFVRGLAFVILSLDTMARTWDKSSYRSTADRLIDTLLNTETPMRGMTDASIFGSGLPDAEWRPELDSQAAALLALARIACSDTAGPHVVAAIERGVKALRTGTPMSDSYGNDPLNHDTIVISRQRDDDEHVDTGFWTYKLGLVLRALATIDHGIMTGRIAISAATHTHIDRLRSTAQKALAHATVCRDDTIEVRTSYNAGETNSETQPWVALGLIPEVDCEILGGDWSKSDWLYFPVH